MSFALTNIASGCQENLSNKKTITKAADLVFVVAAAIISGLILGGIITNIGTTGNGLAWGLIGLGGSIVIADMLTAIVKAVKGSHSREEIKANKGVACHQILNGLYLGNSEAFAQTTHFECRFPDAMGRLLPVDTSNPLEFTTVITACPMVAIFGDYADWEDKSAEEFADAFAANNIRWHHVGKMATDDPSYWEALVYDCTCLDTELGRKALPTKGGMEQEEFVRIRGEKANVILQTPVQQWFEPIFKEIDEGVRNNGKVLVHCQAGASRSASILAAYLINRFGVSSEQAIAFLKSKRMCVDPKFAEQLKAYDKALHPSRWSRFWR